MKRPKITDSECKRLTMSDIPIVKYSKMQDKYIDYLKAQNKQLTLTDVSQQRELFSFADMRDAFNAGDKFRLYLDKDAVGLGYPHDKNIPTSDNVMKTMCFDKWIESKR